ncbi:MAG: hypothetical protein JNJ59_17390 [Deltaproteobacteria bacterium]|nr:hypothetical protein [Deltaproteobacteria bacterium]
MAMRRAWGLWGLLVSGAGLGVLSGAGCGTSCPDIVRHREAFWEAERSPQAQAVDAQLEVPFPLVNEIIAGHLARRPPVRIELPLGRFGLDLRLSLGLERVTVEEADGKVQATAVLALIDGAEGGTRIAELEVESELKPRLADGGRDDPRRALALSLSAADLGAVRPKTTPEGARALARWLRAKLPAVASALASDELVQAVADEALGFFASDLWPDVKGRLLGDAPLFDARVALPELPIASATIGATRRVLVVSFVTSVAGATALGTAPERPRAGRMVLRMSGGTAMGLINRGMARGELPRRFDGRGQPAPEDGIWEAGLAWRGGSSPLLLNLWRTRESCERAEVAARVDVYPEGDKVRVEVREGRLVTVRGPAFAEAFAWLDTLFGKALETTLAADALVRFDAGPDRVQLRLVGAAVGPEDVVLELEVGVAARDQALAPPR